MDILCGQCDTRPAIYLCSADQTALCRKCKKIHLTIDSPHDLEYILCDLCQGRSKKFKLSDENQTLCFACIGEEPEEEIEILGNDSDGASSNTELLEHVYETDGSSKAETSTDEAQLSIIHGVLFESIVDNAQSFTINKLQINTADYEKLMNTLKRKNKLIGVYGCEQKCLELLSNFLSTRRLYKKILKKLKEGIVYFYCKKSSRLGLYFKCRDPNVYIHKPYPHNSKEFIFVRLLFDICSVVICCPPQEAIENWYYSKKEGEQNPFVPKLHKGMKINLERKRTELSDITDVTKVVENVYYRGDLMISLTADPYYHIFTIKKSFQDNKIEKKKIIEATQKLFNKIGNQINTTGLYSFVKSMDNAACFLTFKNSCERSLRDANALCASIKGLCIEALNVITDMVDSKFQEFVNQLKSYFKYKDKIGGMFSSKTLKTDLEILNQTLKKFDFKSVKNKSKELRNYIIDVRVPEEDNPKMEKADPIKLYDLFVDKWNKDLESWYQPFASNLVNEVFANAQKLIDISIDIKKKYIYSFETINIIHTETELILEGTGIENKYTAEEDFLNAHIVSFSENMAYLLLSNSFRTQIVQFNPLQNYAFEISVVSTMESDFLLASGSSPNLFVAFQNSINRAYFGAVQQGKFISRGTELKVYMAGVVNEVVSACILPKKRRLLLLNEVGCLFYMELLSQDKLLHPVKVAQLPHGKESKGALDPVDFIHSQSGRPFLEIKSSVDETTYLLRTKQDIELYDINFKFLKKVSIQPSFVGFKCVTDEMFNIILTFDSNSRFKAHRFLGERDFIGLNQTIKKHNEIPGNPIIDVVHFSLAKFGKKVNLISDGDSEKDFFVYYDQKNSKIDQYIKSIATIKQSLRYQGIISPENYQKLEDIANELLISKNDLGWIILTRQPLHLASIQEGNLIPLQNGLNNAENLNEELDSGNNEFIQTFVNYIKLGYLESLISSSSDLRVIAIIGKQSSGKSYLLNRLFATRFDVAAHRCTDGIWLSLANLDGNLFIIMDCEGLFSVERTVQEEIKLCLFLSAIADVTILNQDLTFNRNLTYLFEKFTFAMDRVKGSNLFKGRLEVALRDVGENQDEEALTELEKFIRYLTNSNKADFLINLFQGQFYCTSYHNYENEKLFDSAVEERRLDYIENVPIRWKSGKDLLMTMKTTLATIYADDCTSIDERACQISIAALKKNFKEIIEDISSANQILKPEIILYSKLEFLDQEIEINIPINSITIDLKEPLKPFKRILLKKTAKSDCELYHNDWYLCIDSLISSYFALWRDEMLNHFKESLPQSAELMQLTESEIAAIERDLDKIINKHSICRRKCNQCERYCLKNLNHTSECECTTNHKCPFACSICENSNICASVGGHKGEHMCNKKKHTCGRECAMFSTCGKLCTKSHDHEGEHMCGESKHPCGKKCEMYDYCKRLCDKDCLEDHEVHDCGQSNCPMMCAMPDCGMACASQNHLHSLSKKIEFPQEKKSHEQVHICNRTHKCNNLCEEKEGICAVETKNEIRIFDNGLNKFSYHYTKQTAKTCECAIVIPQYKISHKKKHKCASKVHSCEVKCPDCDAFCNNPADHEGLHSSGAHRNKEKCIYLAKMETFDVENEEDDNEGLSEGMSRKTIRKFRAGEAAKPDFCDQSCLRKGRGHSHPLECPGGKNCFEKTLVGLAVHSKDRYHPSTDVTYDLLECTAYWRHHNWEPPVEGKNPEAQQLFSKCNYFCNSPEHLDIIYCEDDVYHSFSDKYADHDFSCHHVASCNFDICFVLDCTGSMSSSFPKVVEVITSVINKYMSRGISTKFAIVGYTDHHGDSGGLDPLNPVTIYPPSKNLNDFDQAESIKFLNKLQTGGGGANFGEAMIDGMYNAFRLQWRPTTSKIYFIIGDDCPHGKEFYDGTTYPGGCPCGRNWRSVLQDIKSQRAVVKLVKLGTILNKTADLFKAEYGENLEIIPLDGMTNLAETVVTSIVNVIEHNLEFARA